MAKQKQTTTEKKVNELKKKYYEEIVPEFMKKFGVKNPLAVPRIKKVVLNIGVGKEHKDAAILEEVEKVLTQIAGQKAVFTRAKKSIAGFNVRKGDIIGVKVTLRKDRMWEFLYKFVNIVLPRVKDFKGIDPDNFDKAGNYTLGLTEYLVFPEVNPVKIKNIKGISIAIVFNNSNPEYSRFILEKLGFVFKNKIG